MLGDPSVLDGVALALASAVALSVGNQLRARGAGIEAEAQGSSAADPSWRRSTRDATWPMGAMLLVVAILLQICALVVAPLVVVQPVGVAALLCSTLLTAWRTRRAPTARALGAMAVCVLGTGVFVTVAASVATDQPIGDAELVAVLAAFGALLVVAGGMAVAGRRAQVPPGVLVLLGGTFSAFVAVLGKTVILQTQSAPTVAGAPWDRTNLLTLACVVGVGVAAALALRYVQRAYATVRTELAQSGLTVADPVVAVVVGGTILHELSGAPVWALLAMLASGAVAVAGIFALLRPEPAGRGARLGGSATLRR